MSKHDEIARRVGPADRPAYDAFHATVVDAIRHGTSGVQSSRMAAEEALMRLRGGPRPMLPRAGLGEERLVMAVAAAVERAVSRELSTDDAAHAALRELGAAVPPRGPDDPFPDLHL